MSLSRVAHSLADKFGVPASGAGPPGEIMSAGYDGQPLGLQGDVAQTASALRGAPGRISGCGCYGVIAMAVGLVPTLIGLPALLEVVLMGITVPEPLMTM